jgi:hypothetical protein
MESSMTQLLTSGIPGTSKLISAGPPNDPFQICELHRSAKMYKFLVDAEIVEVCGICFWHEAEIEEAVSVNAEDPAGALTVEGIVDEDTQEYTC